MRRAERVVDVEVAELAQLFGERAVVLLFAGMKAEILDEQHLARLQRARLLLRLGAHAVVGPLHVGVRQLRQSIAHRLERILLVALALSGGRGGWR